MQGQGLRRRALWMKHLEQCGELRFPIIQNVNSQPALPYSPYMTMAADLVSSTSTMRQRNKGPGALA